LTEYYLLNIIYPAGGEVFMLEGAFKDLIDQLLNAVQEDSKKEEDVFLKEDSLHE